MENINKITGLLKQTQYITFAYIFGSRVRNQARFGSDLDVALYFDREPDLMEIGMLASELEEAAGCKIDLVRLNGLPEKHPALAYAVISEGKLLFCNHEKIHVAFKKSAMLRYFDFKPVIDLFERKLAERIANRKFGAVEK